MAEWQRDSRIAAAPRGRFAPRSLQSPWTRLLCRLLASGFVEAGRLDLVLPDGGHITFRGTREGAEAMIVLHRDRAARRLLLGGGVGFAEAFVDGDWDSPDLPSALELAARNHSRMDGTLRGAWPLRILGRVRHLLAANTRRGSRRNIAFHYDLGNAFFRRWLDETMLYSSALYDATARTLEEAQAEKLRRIAALLDPAPGARVLEIGCGWGALMAHLVRAFACSATGLTLSRAQHDHAVSAFSRAGLCERAEVRLEDYRDATGVYDRVVSIEMVEAVGEENWPLYFATLRDRLKPGGVAVVQAITIDDARFARYRRGADFIQRYIFPGGMLPSPSAIGREAAAAGLVLDHEETFGESYARTLAEWRRRFLAAWPEIQEMGFDLRFKRLWEFYLAYCEAGFRAGIIDVGLYRFVRPR